MAINNTAFRQVVGRNFNIDSIAGQNPDAVTAHAARNMREDDMAVVKLYRKSRTWEDLLDVAGHLDWTLFGVLCGVGFWLALCSFANSTAASDRDTP